MRLAALTLLVFGLCATSAVASAKSSSLLIENGRGTIAIEGKRVLVGRIEKGSLEIIDLTPSDQWSPYVNGVPRGKVTWIRGRKTAINFRVAGGRYRLVAHGEGISISARGSGECTVDGEPDPVGDAGSYAVGDNEPQQIPDEPLRLSFGAPDAAPSAP
jgi:hypothetical protein